MLKKFWNSLGTAHSKEHHYRNQGEISASIKSRSSGMTKTDIPFIVTSIISNPCDNCHSIQYKLDTQV